MQGQPDSDPLSNCLPRLSPPMSTGVGDVDPAAETSIVRTDPGAEMRAVSTCMRTSSPVSTMEDADTGCRSAARPSAPETKPADQLAKWAKRCGCTATN